jgi:hypothetical protein
MLQTSATERHHLSLSQLLRRLIDEYPADRIGPVAVADWLGDRALGGVFLLFAMFNLLPLPPGSTFVTGPPLLLISVQLMLGYSRPWFPNTLKRRGITKTDLSAVLGKFLKWEIWIEKLVRPRHFGLIDGKATRIIGAICTLLSVILVLPIPLGNHLPALTMSVFALGIIYRDGLATIVGGLLTIVSLTVVSGMIFATTKAALYIARTYLGF